MCRIGDLFHVLLHLSDLDHFQNQQSMNLKLSKTQTDKHNINLAQ